MDALTEAPTLGRADPARPDARAAQLAVVSANPTRTALFVAAAAIVVAAGVVLRFTALSSSIWFDEAQTVRDVSGSLGHVLHTVVHEEASPPGYFVLLWFWRHAFGSSIAAMRLLSALAGTALIPLAFIAVRRQFGLRAGLAAASLVAASPTLIYYSTELRMYSVLMVECGIGLVAFLSARSSRSTRALCLWAAISILAMWTQYWAALIVAPEAVLLVRRVLSGHENRRGALLAAGTVTLAALPLPVLMLYQNARAFVYGDTLVSMPWQHPSPAFVHSFTHSFGLTERGLAEQLLVNLGGPDSNRLTWLLSALVVAALVLLVRDPPQASRRLATRALVLMLPGLVAAELMIHLSLPVQGRYLLVLWLPAAAVVAYAVTSRSAGVAGLVVLTGLCGIGLATGIVSQVVPQLASRDDTLGAARALGVARADRLIAIDEVWDLFPLGTYRPDARLAPTKVVRVREVDVIRMPIGGEPAPGYHAFADTVPIPRLPPAFRLVRVVRGETFDVERFVSRVPVAVRVAGPGSTFSGSWRFLVEPAGGWLAG